MDRTVRAIKIHMPSGRFPLSNLSIKHRLPLLIGILLLGIITASTWASYRGVRESALAVEFPEHVILAQAGHFLRRVLIADAFLLAIGLVGAFVLSRSITRPLNLLTRSASGISSGDYSGMVHIRSNDELGALGRAFNSMVTRMRGSQNDLEEKIKELNLLQKSARALAAIVESCHDAIIGESLDGTITSWNKSAAKLYGYSAEQAIGQPVAFLFSPEHHEEIAVLLERISHGESIEHFETERITEEGKRISVSLTMSPVLNDSGTIIGSSTIARDITARNLAEEELRRTNQSLERALAALQAKTHELTSMTEQLWQASKLATMGELAASVAHELNNPLATLALHAEALLEQLPSNDPKYAAVKVIEQETERMAALVSNLLMFSRRSHRQISTVDLSDEITSSLNFIQYHLRSRKIEIVQKFAAPLATVQADRQQLRQVFLNLITNASDAMPDGGILTVSSRAGAMANGHSAVIVEFSDTGLGIKTGDLPKLWEPFFTTKPEGKGTGLGLAICRRAVDEHRGTIEIDTVSRKGTTVRITLPATDEGFEVAA